MTQAGDVVVFHILNQPVIDRAQGPLCGVTSVVMLIALYEGLLNEASDEAARSA